MFFNGSKLEHMYSVGLPFELFQALNVWTFLASVVSSHDQKVLANFSQNPQQWCSLTTLRLLSPSALRVVSLAECLFGNRMERMNQPLC